VTERETLELTLKDLQEKLRLRALPHQMECFDISNLFGTLAVGSMVTFRDGRPDKSNYRHFRVRASSYADDYAMMYEVLKRRYAKLNGEKEKPDLLIVDGGKGQLNVALAVLGELGLSGIPAVGLAKEKDEDHRNEQGKGVDKIYLPRVKDPILLPPHSLSLRTLQQIRDEAHRFALAYHKMLRKKQGLQTILDEVPGIGEVKKKALLKHFGNLQNIQEASEAALGQVDPLTQKDAQTIFSFFHPQGEAQI